MTSVAGATRAGAAVVPPPRRSNNDFPRAPAARSGIVLLDGVAAELVAQRRKEAFRIWIRLARSESSKQRSGQHGKRNSAIDSLVQRPSPFARVFHVRLDAGELWILSQRLRGKF